MPNKGNLAVGFVMGGVVGAGIFSLPYAFAQVGLGRGLLYLAAITALMIITYLMYAEVLLKTPGKHNYVSLAKFYLGGAAEFFSILIAVITVLLVLFIYLVLAGRFVNLIWPVPDSLTALPFWLLASAAIFLSLRGLAEVEFFASIALAVIVLAIFIFSLPNFSFSAFTDLFYGVADGYLFWLPIGPLLFALSGRAAITELINFSKRNSRKIIITAFVLVAIIYLFFVLGVLFLTNGVVSDDTITGLGGQLPLFLMALIVVMGLIALWHIYVFLSFDTVNILWVDLRWPKLLAFLTVILAPLALYLMGWQNFFAAVSLVGGIFAALESILIILMWLKMGKGKLPIWLAYLALIVFVVIFGHELWAQFISLV